LFPFIDSSGEEQMAVEDVKHWNLERRQDGTNIRCTGDDECPVCAMKDDLSKEIWDRVKPQRRFLVNAVVREEGKKGEDTQKILQLGVRCWDQIKAASFSIYDEGGDAFSLDEGHDFKVERVGKDRNTKYFALPMLRPSPIGLDVEPADLDAIIKPADDQDYETWTDKLTAEMEAE
jgi:hypothetical protein